MPEPKTLPAWAEDLRRRYVRGEASVFVLHGNVYDAVISGGETLSITDFLGNVLLQETKDTVANVLVRAVVMRLVEQRRLLHDAHPLTAPDVRPSTM